MAAVDSDWEGGKENKGERDLGKFLGWEERGPQCWRSWRWEREEVTDGVRSRRNGKEHRLIMAGVSSEDSGTGLEGRWSKDTDFQF